jgi:type IV secretion system protein TrbL
MACDPYDPSTYGSCATSIAKSVAGDAFSAIARSFGEAAAAATRWLWAEIGSATAVHLGGAGFATVLGIVAAIAGTVAVALFVIQVLQSVLRREPGGLARALRGLVVAFVAGGAAIAVVNLLLAATDRLAAGIVEVAVGTDPAGLGRLVLGSATVATLLGLVTGPGGAAGVLLLALAILVAVVIIYVALLVRKVLLVLTAVFAPLAFAGSIADITVSWTRRWIELTLALIFSKLVLVLIFVVGYFMLVRGAGQAGSGLTQEVTQVIAGVVVLALAGFAPWVALKMVHFAGEHAERLHGVGVAATGGVAAAGRMGQKVSPMAQKLSSAASAPSGGQGATGTTDAGPSGTPPRPEAPASGGSGTGSPGGAAPPAGGAGSAPGSATGGGDGGSGSGTAGSGGPASAGAGVGGAGAGAGASGAAGAAVAL